MGKFLISRFSGVGVTGRGGNRAGYWLLSPTMAIMAVVTVAPMGLLALTSLTAATGPVLAGGASLSHYAEVLGRAGYRALFWRSIGISALVTAATVLLAYPMAYFVAFHAGQRKFAHSKTIWMIALTIPFWTSYLLRVFAWKIILGYGGVINSALLSLHLISQPLGALLYNPFAVVVTLTHAWAAFAILPIYVSLEKIDRSLLEAATDLGDGPLKRFLRVTLPLSLPGTIAATLLVFIPTVGDYLTPSLVGGTSGIMVGNSIATLYGKANNGPLGAALSIAMMLAITLAVCAFLALIGPKRLKRSGA
jgi:spermidine/putrescine transport system permease protein